MDLRLDLDMIRFLYKSGNIFDRIQVLLPDRAMSARILLMKDVRKVLGS